MLKRLKRDPGHAALRVFEINLPPLRRRSEDVLPLAKYFLQRAAREQHKRILGISLPATRALERYAWPGNVRELQNAIERAVVLARSELVDLAELPAEVRSREAQDEPGPGGGYLALEWPEARKAFERDYFRVRLESRIGRIQDLAHQLGLSRRGLHQKIRELGLEGARSKRRERKPDGGEQVC